MIDQVRPSQLSDWFDQQAREVPDRPALVLDVREPMEVAFASVQPAGFELLHVPMQQVPARLAEIDPERPIACLCHHGMRSYQVAAFLTRNGFERVANIAGGIDAWSAEQDPGVPRY